MKALQLFRRSLSARLALVFGLISLLVVISMGLGIYLLTAHYLRTRAQDDLAHLADFYVAYTAASAPDEVHLAAAAPQIASFFAPQSDYVVRVFGTANGTLLAATRDIGALPSSTALAELGHRRPTLFLATSLDQPDRYYVARPVAAAGGSPLAVIEVSRDMKGMRGFLATLRWVLAGAGTLALMAALVASLLVSRRMTHPLSQMEHATRAIASGDLSRRLEVASQDEIGRLADSINRMATDLARLEGARREFIARISHDLRTPLTAVKGLVVNLQDTAPQEIQASLATLDEQTERLIRLVEDLLILSRLQRGRLDLHIKEIDLGTTASSAMDIAKEKARRLGIALAFESAADMPPVFGDADRLQQVVINLLDNAIKATPAGGVIRVQLAVRGSQVTLTVTDSGRGLTAQEAARAFEPYYRGSGGGTGLGLAISHEILTAHGGSIWLRSRSEGGAEAGFSLPSVTHA